MEALLKRQDEIAELINRIKINFKKDPLKRKTPAYLKTRQEALDNLWGEFESNHELLLPYKDNPFKYFIENVYEATLNLCEEVRTAFSSVLPSSSSKQVDQATEPCGEVDELIARQRTNFRAFMRLLKSIKVEYITENWELEDELRTIKSRWQIIDELHFKIDNILCGEDEQYEGEFSQHETLYKDMKRTLNQKLIAKVHQHQSTPKLEIPVFTGNYTQWPTFHDLFTEAIHNNSTLSKAQKMQHLKGKLKGEAERLIQHLHIAAENYDTAWEILLHRFSNHQILFTNQIEVFLNQPNVHKQTSFELKRLHDTSMECIHAIHNLGVDTSAWDPLLVHLISKKLDVQTYTDYKESRKSPRELPSLGEFMTFLECKFTALEPVQRKERENTSSTSSAPAKQPPYQYKNTSGKITYKNYYQANSTSYISRCPLCNLEHELYRCKRFIAMSPETKLRAISKQKICVNCLYKHHDKTCNSTKRCKECNAEHNTLLHEAFANNVKSGYTQQSSSTPSKHNVNHVASPDEEILLTTILIQVQKSDGSYITLRALLDQGSQISLISENAAQILGLKRISYHASVSGIGTSSKQSKGMITMQCKSIYDDHAFSTQALIISTVINNLPNSSFERQGWSHLQHIKLADPEYNVSRPIDILFDASVYSDIIMSGLIKGPTQAPIAQQTKLGWVLSGNVRTFNCNVVINNLADIKKYWEIEDIQDKSSVSEADEKCEKFYQATTRRLESGRYEVAIPMKSGFEKQLGASQGKAIAQFKQIEQKLNKNPELSDAYKTFMREYEQLGHMRQVYTSTEPSCYLPHHGVLKLDSNTTKLRVVFNASSVTSSGSSLNDLMERGPNLQQDLLPLVLKWRQYKYVLVCDIEKMFRQIMVREEDQPLQSIVWRESSDIPIKHYHLTTLSYGFKASPYIAIRTLQQIGLDHAEKYPLAAEAAKSSFFMDDLLSGHDDIEQAKVLQQQLIQMFQAAGMNLRKWSSNNLELIKDLSSEQLDTPLDFKCIETRKTLGLRWNPATDTFSFKNPLENTINKSLSKRKLLSDISRIFDPFGWISPITIRAKLLFQKAWTTGVSWDEEVPEEIMLEWNQIKQDFQNIDSLIITRHLGNMQGPFQLHAFCDSSEKAYACVIYIVTQNNKGETISTLVAAKTKLAPLNKVLTIPRLELCSALLLTQLVNTVLQTYENKDNITITAWSDSMITLGWLQGEATRWKQFVSHRVQQIKEVVPASNWRHVRSEDNAADCASRGISTQQLKEHRLWWEGPEWLKTYDPESAPTIKYENPKIEERIAAQVNMTVQAKPVPFTITLLCEHSSMSHVTRVVAWILRFIAKSSKRHNAESSSSLTSAELNNAEQLIVKEYQHIEYEEDITHLKKHGRVATNSKLVSLNPFLDEHSILRVGGRLRNSHINASAKHPIILSSHSRLTELLINQAHQRTLHGGARLTLSYIRERFWIVSGIRTVKRQLRKCVKCRRFTTETHQQIMADLPAPRVTPSRPFTHTGIDFTGHVEVKSNKGRGIRTSKGYVAVFVCLATKAVHLELVSDLSTPMFLQAFHRFCNRHSTPSHCYSDNGTNFVGANRLLKREYQEIIQNINKDFFDNINHLDIQWHFNAPAWPSAGGLWESAVKSLKYHLKRVLGDQKLTYEEFTTLLTHVEACLNSRPLCALTEDPDYDHLTPGHFLVGGPILSRPQVQSDNISLPKRWQLIQAMNRQIWKCWSNDYLQQLQARSKWRTPIENIKKDDVVVIREDNIPPGRWAIGRVIEIHPGKDNHIRVVTLKPKEISSNDQSAN